MTTVERIRTICRERKIPISRLEKACGFANGYISQLKKGTIPDDRLLKIASFLELPVEALLSGVPPVNITDYEYLGNDFALMIEEARILNHDEISLIREIIRRIKNKKENEKSALRQ